jgi:hypothetical protein
VKSKGLLGVSWMLVLLVGWVLAVSPAWAEKGKITAKLAQCKKTKVRNKDGDRVYVFRVESQQVTQSHKTYTTLYVEVTDNKGKKYFGSLKNQQSLLSYYRGSSYANVIWRYEININEIKDAVIKAYVVELNDQDDKVLDVSKYAVGDVESWKKGHADSAPIKIIPMAPDPALE